LYSLVPMHVTLYDIIYYNKLKNLFAEILMHYSSKLEMMKLKRHALPDCICDHSPRDKRCYQQTNQNNGADAHHDHSRSTRQIYLLQVTGI